MYVICYEDDESNNVWEAIDHIDDLRTRLDELNNDGYEDDDIMVFSRESEITI